MKAPYSAAAFTFVILTMVGAFALMAMVCYGHISTRLTLPHMMLLEIAAPGMNFTVTNTVMVPGMMMISPLPTSAAFAVVDRFQM